jgi:hypothetical protein
MKIIKGNLYKSSSDCVLATKSTDERLFCGVDISDGDFRTDWITDAFQPYSAEIIIKEVIDFSKVQFVEMASGEVVISDGDERNDKFVGVNLKTAKFEAFKKSEAKRVVTPKFE